MNIVAFIPARSGSKSIPGKNIKELGGKPLLSYSIETGLKTGLRTVVNSDSKEYLEIAEQYGAEVMLRPEKLAGDKTSILDVLKSEVFKINLVPDAVLLLQPTSPFRNLNIVKAALSYFTSNLDKFDSLISVEKVPDKYHPYAMIVGSEKRMLFGKVKWFQRLFKTYKEPLPGGYPIRERVTRRQDMPPVWLPDGSIYIFKTGNLKKGSLYGDNVLLLETEGTPNINTLEDWNAAEEYWKQNRK